MAIPGVTPNSDQRTSLRKAYRARGRGEGNLWLVYSVKTQKDWILPSDRQFIHWLCLESDPLVKHFDLAPPRVLSHDGEEDKATELDAIVTFYNGLIEWHEVKAGTNKKELSDQSQFNAQAAAASKEHVVYKILNDNYFNPRKLVALRWHKPLMYAAIIKNQQQTQCNLALLDFIKKHRTGNIDQLLTNLDQFDRAITLGVFMRIVVSGAAQIDLSHKSFGLTTKWKYCD